MHEVFFQSIGTNGFHIKAENERFSTVGSPCRENIEFENFTSSFGRLPNKNCTKERAALAARSFFRLQPIIFVICDVVVAVAVVVS